MNTLNTTVEKKDDSSPFRIVTGREIALIRRLKSFGYAIHEIAVVMGFTYAEIVELLYL